MSSNLEKPVYYLDIFCGEVLVFLLFFFFLGGLSVPLSLLHSNSLAEKGPEKWT